MAPLDGFRTPGGAGTTRPRLKGCLVRRLAGRACLLPSARLGRGVGEHLERLFLAHLFSGDRDRIFSRQPPQADVVPRVREGGDQLAERELATAVRRAKLRDRWD